MQNEEMFSLVRKLNPNKTSGSDGISGKMLLLCDNAVLLPLKIIFQNILESSTYPDMWKRAKQLVKNYRPTSLLVICGKSFEKNPL